MDMTLAIWLVLGACAIAVATDLRSRRIPNWLTAALAVAALGLHAAGGLAAVGIALAIARGCHVSGADRIFVRLARRGRRQVARSRRRSARFPDAVPFLVYTAIGGGILAVVFAVVTGRVGSVMTNVGLMLRPFAYKGTQAVAPTSPSCYPMPSRSRLVRSQSRFLITLSLLEAATVNTRRITLIIAVVLAVGTGILTLRYLSNLNQQAAGSGRDEDRRRHERRHSGSRQDHGRHADRRQAPAGDVEPQSLDDPKQAEGDVALISMPPARCSPHRTSARRRRSV
jgi:Flp pilus assembly protein protease CpaA